MTSSSDGVLVLRSPGLCLREGLVHDLCCMSRTDVGSDGLRVLGQLAGGPVRLVDVEQPGDVVNSLAVHGFLAVRFPVRVVAQVLLRCVLRGSDVEFRRLMALSRRRVDIPRCSGSMTLVAACIWAAVLAHRRPLVALSAGTATLGSLALGPSPSHLVDASLAPLLLVLTLAAHEAGHLVALRRLPGRQDAGALVIGALRLSVVRPQLAGDSLRRVALAGPVVGIVASVPVAAVAGVAPGCGLAGMIGLALHAANLLPSAPDGGHAWSGLDRERELSHS